jgi:hypothetical protein
MRTVKEPDKLQSAVGGLWSAYLAVLATLRLEFARVAALALGTLTLTLTLTLALSLGIP